MKHVLVPTMKVDKKQLKTLFSQSMKRICKGKYKNVDPRNTECLKLIEEYNKVHTHTHGNFS